MEERIQKVLAKAGISSRREAERMILEGRVTVNGKVLNSMGLKVDPSKDHIRVDGKRLSDYEPKVAIILNKPLGYLSTVKDPLGRPTVMDLLRNVKWRVYPVGRLDFDSEGLMLLTNDGELAYRLTHPKFEIPRTYLVKVKGIPEERKLKSLKKGIMLDDGKAKVVSIQVLNRRERNSWLKVEVREGRNRLIKRIFDVIGHPVLKLKRIKFGPIHLGNLMPGQFRYLQPSEMMRLKEEGLKITK